MGLARGSVPYAEYKRQHRRTIFTAEDWVHHRNSERIVSNLKSFLTAGVFLQLQQELWLVCSVCVGIILAYTLGGVMIQFPALPMQLSSAALGLLLVFRTNASYARWVEGRTTWARIESNARNVIRMAVTFTDLTDPETTADERKAIQHLSHAVWAFCRSMMNRLLAKDEDEDDYQAEMRQTIPNQVLVERILASPERSVAALTEASLALNRLSFDEKRRVEADKSLVILTDCLTTCEKIFKNPVPLVYTRHTARFLSIWMMYLPAALIGPFYLDLPFGPFIKGIFVTVTVAIMVVFFFGIETLASAMEEPFSILPMQDFCDGTKHAMNVTMDWSFDTADSQIRSSIVAVESSEFTEFCSPKRVSQKYQAEHDLRETCGVPHLHSPQRCVASF